MPEVQSSEVRELRLYMPVRLGAPWPEPLCTLLLLELRQGETEPEDCLFI